MSDLDWSTPEGLAAIREHLAARIDGWRRRSRTPWASAPPRRRRSGSSPTSTRRAARHGLPAVVLATVLGHDGSTATCPSRGPARGCGGVAGAGRGVHLARAPEPRRLARGAARARGQPGARGAGGLRGRPRRPGRLGGRRVDAGDLRGPRSPPLSRGARDGRGGSRVRMHGRCIDRRRPAPARSTPERTSARRAHLAPRSRAAAPWVLGGRAARRRR